MPNKKPLLALNQSIKNSVIGNGLVKFTEEPILMLQFGDKDIETSYLISQEELDKSDREWLRGGFRLSLDLT